MKILRSRNESKLGIMLKNKAYTISTNGYPLEVLWDDYWAVIYCFKVLWFYVLKYEK